MHYLYSITDRVNNKIYIGQTNQQHKRWSSHKSYAKHPEMSGQYIHRAMAKYGIDNFIYEVIATCQTQEDANEIESILIAQYDSRDNRFGYNIKPGGLTNGHSDETKEKLRQATIKQIQEKGHPAQDTKRTPEQRETLSHAQQNRNNNYTIEMRERMSLSHMGQKQSAEAVENRKASLKITNDAKIAEKLQSGELKCNAPGCERSGIYKDYLVVNGIRYCAKHGSRIKRNGTLETKPAFRSIGQAPPNKIIFTQDQIHSILSDVRSAQKIGKDFGVTEKVIIRVRRENKV